MRLLSDVQRQVDRANATAEPGAVGVLDGGALGGTSLGAAGGTEGGGGVAEGSALGGVRATNYDTVLTLLKEADESRQEEKLRSEEGERERAERATLLEITISDLRAANHDLRQKLRRLESASAHASAFEIYEAQLGTLTAQLEGARSERDEYEAMCREASLAYEVARDAARVASGEEWPGGISATMEAKLGRVRTHRKALTSSEKELRALREKVADDAKLVRQCEVHKRAAEDATRRMHRLSKEHQRCTQELAAARLLISQVEAQHDDLVAQVRTMREGRGRGGRVGVVCRARRHEIGARHTARALRPSTPHAHSAPPHRTRPP